VTLTNKNTLALRYASLGCLVVAIHGIKSARCTCGDPNCDQPARHPRTEHGIRDATTDSKLIEQMWATWPKAKIGIAFGKPSKLLGLAIDGEAGRTKLREITENHENLPRTITILDHDQETRFFVRESDDRINREVAEGIRILGDGDFIIAPSSLEDSTASRHFKTGRGLGQVKIARAPQWLFDNRAKHGSGVSSSFTPTPQAAPTVMLVRASEIEPERIGWIWPGIIASGRITGLVGYPGLGKSQVAIDIASTVSTGRSWPGGAANGGAGDVIILAAEDDAADTIVPRLLAAGADLTRVHVVKAVRGDNGVERAFSLADDLDRLEKEYDLRQVRLLVVDPVSAYLGTAKSTGINRNHGTDVRTVLGRFAMFAERHALGVLAISHLNKTSGARAITRFMGAVEWVAAPRAVFLVTEEAGTGRRLFLPLKNNLAPDRIGYAFEIKNKVVADGIRTSAVLWSNDPVTISADEALAAAAKKATTGAVDFLEQVLSDGPVDQTEIVRLGKEAGYSEKSLRTAREKLGVTPTKEGFGADGKWRWVPAGGATVLRLVVDNDASKQMPSDGQQLLARADDSKGQDNNWDQGLMPDPDDLARDPQGPDGGDVG
jgi:putative DNA primase/helicase